MASASTATLSWPQGDHQEVATNTDTGPNTHAPLPSCRYTLVRCSVRASCRVWGAVVPSSTCHFRR
jgi:hypothetical protein